MSAQQFLIAHGEKAALGVVAVGVCWWVFSTMSDPGLIPRDGLTKQQVEKELEAVRARRESNDPPKLEVPSDYLARMEAALSRPVAQEPRMAWITTPPDIGPRVGNKPYFFVYETRPVAIQAVDRVGSVALTIALPAGARAADPVQARVFDAPEVNPSRDSGVANSARWLGVQVQVRVGDGPWRPLSGSGVQADGMLPLDRLGKPLVLNDLDPWTVNTFRARLLVAASSYIGSADRSRTLLVHEGRFADAAGDPTGVLAVRSRLVDPWPDSMDLTPVAENRRRDLLRPFQQPIAATAVATLKAGPKEALFWGPWGDHSEVVVTDRRRFSLVSARLAQEDPLNATASTPASAIFNVSMFWEKQGRWDPVPQQFKGVSVDGPIGKQIPVAPPGESIRQQADYGTGYILKGTQAVTRVHYHEIVVGRAKPGSKDRTLELRSVVNKRVVSATVQNTVNGNEFTVLPLENIAPSKVDEATIFQRAPGQPEKFRPVYPAIFHFGYNEPEEFKNNPVEFRSFGLSPMEPTRHAPGGGPLAKLNSPIATTNTDYFEMPDGRLVWFYPIDNLVMMWIPPTLTLPANAAAGPGDGAVIMGGSSATSGARPR